MFGKGTVLVSNREREQIAESCSKDSKANRAVGYQAPLAPVLSQRGSSSTLAEGHITIARGEILDLEAAERFRILRSQIERKGLSGERQQVLAVTSAVPGEGKSVISVNLARAFGADPRGRTLIIDCDLRKPNVHRFFDKPQGPGLSDVLIAGKSIRSVLHQVESGLDLITAGSPVVDSTRAIEQPGMKLLIEELRKHYQFIVLDCPPSLFCSEPMFLTHLASSTILVARCWATERKLVKDAVNLIGKQRIVGVVLNECADTVRQYGYYGYYGYDKDALAKAKKRQERRREGGKWFRFGRKNRKSSLEQPIEQTTEVREAKKRKSGLRKLFSRRTKSPSQ